MKTRRLLAALLAVIMVFSMLPVSVFSVDDDTATDAETTYNRVYVKKPADWDTVRIWAWGEDGDAFSGGWANRPTLVQYAPDSDIYYYEDADNVLHEGDSFILSSDTKSAWSTGNQLDCLKLNKLYVLEPDPKNPIVSDFPIEDDDDDYLSQIDGEVIKVPGNLTGEIIAPPEKWPGNPQTDVKLGSDGDMDTYWQCSGQNYYTAKTQYYGYKFSGALINSITFKVWGYSANHGGIRVEVSNDKVAWSTIWSDATDGSNYKVVTLNASNWDTSVMTKTSVWKYVRVAYGDESGYCGWNMLRVCEFNVTGSYVVTEGAEVKVTKFAEPLSTTFGTKANLLAEPYTVQTDGISGLAVVFKVEGIPDGETATIHGVNPQVSNGEGTYGLGFHGNWVNGSCNHFVVPSDGYYAYYFPFNALQNNLNMTGVAGTTKLQNIGFFETGLAWNNGGGPGTTNPDITLSVVGIVESDVDTTDVFMRDTDGTLLAKGETKATIDIDWKNASSAQWKKLTTPADIYSGLGNPDEGWALDHWEDNDGNRVDYILGENILNAVYQKRNSVTYVAEFGDIVPGQPLDVSVKISDAEATPVSGTVTIQFDSNVFDHADAQDGQLTVPYGEVAADGTIADVKLDVSRLVCSGSYKITLTGTAVEANGKEMIVLENAENTVVIENGQDATGAFLTGEPVVINSKADGSAPETQNIWTGDVNLGGAKVATYVFKIDGVESEIDFTQYAPIVNGSWEIGANGNTWCWDNFWGGDAADPETKLKANGFVAGMKIPESGIYYVSLNRRYIDNTWNCGKTFDTANGFKLFADKRTLSHAESSESYAAKNTNENATFQMLAVLAGDLKTTVNFYNEVGGEKIGSHTYQYSKLADWADGNGANTKMKSFGQLLSAADVFAASGLPNPTKSSDAKYVYTFAGWVDADGNPVNDLYYSTDVYATYTAEEKTVTHKVTFMNGSDIVAEQDVYELDTPVAPENPTKADSATGTYTFAGWALTEDGEAVDLSAVVVGTEDIMLYAVYTYADVTFTVTYMNGDATVATETVVRSKDAVKKPTVTKATDAYGTEDAKYYDFAYWAVKQSSEDGDDVYTETDLTNIQSDITVYAQYTTRPVEEWFTVTWYTKVGGNRIDSGHVARGDSIKPASWAAQWADMDGKADENYWYTFSGWDKDTTNVTSDLSVYPTYSTKPVETGDMQAYKTESVSGKVGELHELWTETVTLDKLYKSVTAIVKIAGASEDNPIQIGDVYGAANDNNSNNCWFMIPDGNANGKLLQNITEPGWYYITFGANVISNSQYNGEWSIGKMQYLAFDSSKDGRCPPSIDASGEATYVAYAFMGEYQPTVRYYDADGNWLSTNKLSYFFDHSTVNKGAVLTADGFYNGKEIENFLYWRDADGNRVTEIFDNMDLYAVCEKPSTGSIEIDPSANVTALRAGTKVMLPVIAKGVTFNSIDITVTSSANVTVTDVIPADGFEINALGMAGKYVAAATEDIIADENGVIIAYVELTIGETNLALGEQVDVTINVNQLAKLDGTDVTKTVAATAEYSTKATVYYGDVDANGKIDLDDAVAIAQYYANWGEEYYPVAITCGDVDGNGKIDFDDAVAIAQYYANWGEECYPERLANLTPAGINE